MTFKQKIVITVLAVLTFTFLLSALLNYLWLPDFSAAELAFEAIPLAICAVVGAALYVLWRPVERSWSEELDVDEIAEPPAARIVTADDLERADRPGDDVPEHSAA